jgi:hypothetical protein
MRTNIDRGKTYIAQFNRFEVAMTGNAALDCSHSGDCADDVAHHAPLIQRSPRCTREALADELREYGAWNGVERADDAANWQRIVWLAANDICENEEEDA